MTELEIHHKRDIAYPDAVGTVNPDKVFHPSFTFGPWIERIGGHALPAEISKGGAHDQINLIEFEEHPWQRDDPFGFNFFAQFLYPKSSYMRGGGW